MSRQVTAIKTGDQEWELKVENDDIRDALCDWAFDEDGLYVANDNDNVEISISIADADFTPKLKQLCKDNEWTFVLAEVSDPQGRNNIYPHGYEVPCAAASGRAGHYDENYDSEIEEESGQLLSILDSDPDDPVSGASPMSERIHTSSICLRL